MEEFEGGRCQSEVVGEVYEHTVGNVLESWLQADPAESSASGQRYRDRYKRRTGRAQEQKQDTHCLVLLVCELAGFLAIFGDLCLEQWKVLAISLRKGS